MPAKKAAAKVKPQNRKLAPDDETLQRLTQIGQSQADSVKAAGFLGVTVEEFERFIAESPAAADAYDLGLNKGRALLHKQQFDAAKAGDQRALKEVLRNAPPRKKAGRPKVVDLTPSQQLAVHHYVEHGVATDAYRCGYPTSKKWSPLAVRVAASRLFATPHVAAAVSDLQKKLARIAEKKFLVTQERVIEELARIGFANMQDYVVVGEDGRPSFDITNLTRDQFAAISEITVEEIDTGPRKGIRTKFKLHDKKGALVDLGKHLGLFAQRVELTGPDGGPLITEQRTIVILPSNGREIEIIDGTPIRSLPKPEPADGD